MTTQGDLASSSCLVEAMVEVVGSRVGLLEESLVQVRAELATMNQTLTAHAVAVDLQSAGIDELLSTKLGEDSLTTIHDELRRASTSKLSRCGTVYRF